MTGIEDAEMTDIIMSQGETNTRVDQERGHTKETESSEVVRKEMIEGDKGHQGPKRGITRGGNLDLDHQVYRQAGHQAHFIQLLAQITE